MLIAAATVAALVAGRGRPAHGAVALDAMTQDSARPTDRIDITTLTVGTAPNRLLLVGISIAGTTESATRITWAGVPLTRTPLGRVINTTGAGCSTDIWQLVAPAPGHSVLEITVSSAVQFGVGAVAYTGVDQNNPFDGAAARLGHDQAVTLTADGSDRSFFASACVAGSWAGRLGVAPNAMAGPGQAALWDFTEMNLLGVGSHRLDVASSLSWEIQTADPFVWAVEGVMLNAAPPPPDAAATDAQRIDASAIDAQPVDAAAPDAAAPADAATEAPAPPADAPLSEDVADLEDAIAPHGHPEDAAGAGDEDAVAPDRIHAQRLQVGCGCRTGGGTASASWWLLLALLAATARSRGRR
jgi:MYXO-CTERM domain-containing protein